MSTRSFGYQILRPTARYVGRRFWERQSASVAIESPKLSANSLGEIKAARENFISVLSRIPLAPIHRWSIFFG
jgi:hypothetical protein